MAPPDAAPDPTGAQASRQTPRIVLTVVFATILIDFVGFSVLIPVLPLYAERLGATADQVGLILAIHALSQLLFLPAWGWISDRLGRRPVLLVSLAGTVLSFIVLSLADSIGVIYLSRALSGFFAASIGTAQAVVTDVTSAEERARGMGLIGAAFGVGMILGPVLGGVLAAVDEKAPFYAVAALAAGSFVLAAVALPETHGRDKTPTHWRVLASLLVPVPLRVLVFEPDRRIRLYLYLFFHLFTAFAVLEGLVTLFLYQAHGADELDTAWIFAWLGIVLALTQAVLLRHLVVRLGEPALVVAGIACMGAGLACVALAPSLPWFYGVGTLIAFGNGIAFPSFTSLFSQACVAGEEGSLLAQSQSMGTLGRVLGPWAGGFAMEWWGLDVPFWIASAMMFAAAGLFVVARRTLVGELP